MIKMDNPPKTELVALDIEGPICRITLNRESKYNAMNVQMITELCELFDWTAQRSVGATGNLVDEDGNQYLRIIVFSGAGKHFCAGADINICLLYTSPSPRDS